MSFRNCEHRALARKRRDVGMTQHALAEKTGIPFSRIVYHETGRIILDATELDKIRAVLRQRGRQVAAQVGA
jgi:predicted transcriptional regulator